MSNEMTVDFFANLNLSSFNRSHSACWQDDCVTTFLELFSSVSHQTCLSEMLGSPILKESIATISLVLHPPIDLH
mgnify:CR=1 FL=1